MICVKASFVLVLAFIIALIGPTMAIEGHIVDVWWGYSDIRPIVTISPQVTVQNDCSERALFHVLFSVQDPTGKWYKGGCGSGYIDPGKSGILYPVPVTLYDSMPKGSYAGRIELLGNYCFGELDTMTKPDAYVCHNG
jgi:hypothetical protein